MKKKNLLFPVLAAMMFAGCSNDDVLSGNVPKTFTGDEAYIKVRLSDAGSQTRATTSDPGYEYGTETEHNVTNAHFYFYDADGVFVSEGSAWNENGTVSTGDPTNIEFESNNVVVLKGLTKKNYPKYMVTVLNLPPLASLTVRHSKRWRQRLPVHWMQWTTANLIQTRLSV